MPEARKAEVINYRGQRKGRLKILEVKLSNKTHAHTETYIRDVP